MDVLKACYRFYNIPDCKNIFYESDEGNETILKLYFLMVKTESNLPIHLIIVTLFK